MEIVDGRGLLIFERGSRNLFGAIKGTKATGLRPRSIPSLSPSVVFIGLFGSVLHLLSVLGGSVDWI
jgi:hypothetical protein